MKVKITGFALQELMSIHRYYKSNVSKNIADKLIYKILDSVDTLGFLYASGSIEQNLKRLKLNHRFIVAGNYKIIYRVESEVVKVTDVFDTRQNPRKILRRNKLR